MGPSNTFSPAFITTRPRTLMKGMPWYRIPTERVTIRIEIGGLIHAEPDESARQLKSRVQAVYERRLTELGMVRDVPFDLVPAADFAVDAVAVRDMTPSLAGSRVRRRSSRQEADHRR